MLKRFVEIGDGRYKSALFFHRWSSILSKKLREVPYRGFQNYSGILGFWQYSL